MASAISRPSGLDGSAYNYGIRWSQSSKGGQATAQMQPLEQGEPSMSRSSETHDLEAQVDQLCDAFEADWKANRRPDIEECLKAMPEPGRAELLRELLKIDVAYLFRAGAQPTAKEYQDRFGAYGEVIAEVFAPKKAAQAQSSLTPAALPAAGSHPGQNHQASANIPDVPGYEILREQGHGGMGVVYRAREHA